MTGWLFHQFWRLVDFGIRQVEEDVEVEIGRVEIEGLVDEWVKEVQSVMDVGLGKCEAWDDVKGGDLPIEEVREARKEEVDYMENRKLWSLKPLKDCWDKTGRDPVSMKWVDTNKGDDHSEDWEIRCRLVARDFKGKDTGRDDLFAETPPLEAKRWPMSRAMTKRRDGRRRKMMLIDARKAHLNPKCEDDVYVTLPEECKCPEGMCAKLNFWLYGFRPAAAAWEKHYSEKFESVLVVE